jgi:hypothetical protein
LDDALRLDDDMHMLDDVGMGVSHGTVGIFNLVVNLKPI